MIIVLSSAKTQIFTPLSGVSVSQPPLLKKTETLLRRCRELSREEIKEIMKVSDKLAEDAVVGAGTRHPQVDWLFQVAFAATAATIVSGAVAGRMSFPGYLVYTAVLTGLIYPISGYWKWGGLGAVLLGVVFDVLVRP